MQPIDFSAAIVAYNVCRELHNNRQSTTLKIIRANNSLKHELNKCFKGSDLPLKFILCQFDVLLDFPLT